MTKEQRHDENHPECGHVVTSPLSPDGLRRSGCRLDPQDARSRSLGSTPVEPAARRLGWKRAVVGVDQSVSPAVAEMVGCRRERTASMISLGSMPCR